MSRERISTASAPAAVGPYSQAIRFEGKLVWTAGQVPIDPATGKISGTNVTEQTEQVMKNLSAILEASGSSLSGIVKSTVFLKSMGDFAAMNEVYSKYVTVDYPARSTVEVSRLPLDALVEIECLALVR